MKPNRTLPWITFITGAAVLVIFLFPKLVSFLEYRRESVMAGEFHRILSCHLTHWSWNHLVWDLLTFMALGFIAETACRRVFVTTLLVSACLIPVSVILFLPEMSHYRGLSGLDAALFPVVFFPWKSPVPRVRTRADFIIPFAAFGVLAAKVLFELISADTIFTASSGLFVPVPLAHFVGGLAGLMISGLFWFCCMDG